MHRVPARDASCVVVRDEDVVSALRGVDEVALFFDVWFWRFVAGRDECADGSCDENHDAFHARPLFLFRRFTRLMCFVWSG